MISANLRQCLPAIKAPDEILAAPDLEYKKKRII